MGQLWASLIMAGAKEGERLQFRPSSTLQAYSVTCLAAGLPLSKIRISMYRAGLSVRFC